MSRDSQVAEVALSLSDFNPAAKMAPNPDLLCEMTEQIDRKCTGNRKDSELRVLQREEQLIWVRKEEFGRCLHTVWECSI